MGETIESRGGLRPGVFIGLLSVALSAMVWPHSQPLLALSAVVALFIAVREGLEFRGLVPLIAVLLLGWGVLSLLWSVDIDRTLQFMTFDVALVGVFLLGFTLSFKGGRLTALAAIAAAGWATSVLYMLLARVDLTSVPLDQALQLESVTRPALPWLDTNYSAFSVVLGLAALMALTIGVPARRWRVSRAVLGAIAVLPMVAAVLQSQTRAALLAVAVIFALRPVAKRWGKGLLIAGLAVYVVLTLASVVGLLGAAADAIQLDRLRSGDGGLGGREELWAVALEQASRSPLLGVGRNAYEVAILNGLSTHNVALHAWLSLGLVGLLLYTLLFVASFGSPSVFKASDDATLGSLALLLWCSLPLLFSGAWVDSLANWTLLGVAGGLSVRSTVAAKGHACDAVRVRSEEAISGPNRESPANRRTGSGARERLLFAEQNVISRDTGDSIGG